MRHNSKYITLKLILFFSLFFLILYKAGAVVLTDDVGDSGLIAVSCKYKVKPSNYDDSFSLEYHVFKDGTVSLPFKDNYEHKHTFSGKQTFTYWSHDLYFKESYFKAAKQDGKYKCPQVSVITVDSFSKTIMVGDPTAEYPDAILAEIVSMTLGENEEGVKTTSSCEYSSTPIENTLGDIGINLKLNFLMTSSGKRYIDINGKQSEVYNYEDKSLAPTYGGKISIDGYTFFIRSVDVEKIFRQFDATMISQKNFQCSTKLYIEEKNKNAKEYIITTTAPSKFIKYNCSTNCAPEDENIVIDPKTGKPIDCSDFVTDEGVNIISDLFNIIMIIGPILALVLGGVDFAKATLASDENALKKAGTNFSKRIIAAILLFILPMIINLVLGLAFNAGVFGTMEKVPEVCLIKK